GLAQVERERALAGIRLVEHGAGVQAVPPGRLLPGARAIQPRVRLDADDLGAEVRQDARAQRPRQHPAKIDDADVAEHRLRLGAAPRPGPGPTSLPALP